jgi:hypothetical protein
MSLVLPMLLLPMLTVLKTDVMDGDRPVVCGEGGDNDVYCC